MIRSDKQKVDARFTIYRGLPFYLKLLYKAPSGAPVEVSDWIAMITLKDNVDSEDALYTFSTTPEVGQGQITLSKGQIVLEGTEELDDPDWEQAVGHLVLGPTQDTVAPIAFFAFDVKRSTTGVPPEA